MLRHCRGLYVMNILFFTKSKKYTCKILEYMLNEHTLVGVVCKNKQILHGTEMEQICIRNGIDIYDNEEVYCRIDENTMPQIDLAISNTYGRLIKPSFINYVNGNCINFHGAILPDYKGWITYNHGLLNEEKYWGVTAHYVNEKFDEGEIIEIRKFPIDSRKISVRKLEEETQKNAYELTISLIERWKTEGRLPSYPQPSGGRYYSKEDFEAAKKVLVTDSSDEVIKKIHAFWCPPYEGAYIEIDGVHFQLCLPEEKGDD